MAAVTILTGTKPGGSSSAGSIHFRATATSRRAFRAVLAAIEAAEQLHIAESNVKQTTPYLLT